MPSHIIEKPELEQLATLIRSDSALLPLVVSEPDRAFQTEPQTINTTMNRVIDCLDAALQHRNPDDLPAVIYAWGKARVGSTALTNLFGIAGVPAFYQPVKAMLRQALTGCEIIPWPVPSSVDHPTIFAKETAGPYSLAECLYMPVEALVAAGYPSSKLHLIMLDRDPADSLVSWLEKFRDRLPLQQIEYFHILSSLNGIRVEAHARKFGIGVTHYVYEASRQPVRAARALFRRLGLNRHFTAAAVTDWQGRGDLESSDCGIIYPPQPETFEFPGLHGADSGYCYHPRAQKPTDAQIADMTAFGLYDLYQRSVTACAQDLDVRIADLVPPVDSHTVHHATAA
ncbi:MAG: sulfotransferase family protein [Azospirillaceae bacterium]|nr:sulfotransferase family protein [Azospirillaceae bacterium]